MNCHLVRHGEIESNVKKFYAGWSEEELTPRGIQQAKEAGRKLVHLGIGGIYCSPLKRAVQTADIIGHLLKKEPVVEDSFKELRLGTWEGKSEEEVKRDFPEQWQIWNTRPAELVLEGRETLQELLERVLDGIERVKAKGDGKAVLIVTHVAIIRVLLLHSQRMDLNLHKSIDVPNGKIFEIGDEKVKKRC